MHLKSLIPCQSHVSVDIRDSPVGTQQEVDHEPNFSINQERLAEIVQINDAASLEQTGGVLQIAAALGTNIYTGIVGDERDIGCRQRAFGFNQELEGQDNPTKRSFNELLVEAFKDSTIVLLLCCAALYLLIGIKTNGPQEGFLDGAIIFLTIFLVVNFSLLCRFLKTRLTSRKLQKRRRVVSVVRQGRMQEIQVSALVVGDIVFLEAGNQVPADGLFIHGDSFKLDDGLVESGTNYTSMFRVAKVVEGNCLMLVTSVGKNTERSKLIGTVLRNNSDQEPKLQAAIDKMNSRLEKLWLTLCLLILSVQVLRCFMQKSASDERHTPDSKCVKNTVEDIVNESTKLMKKQGGKINGLVSVLGILLFATRDGLPLGILVLCYWSSRKMKSFGATVQKLSACVTIGLATSICLGKTNALTLQHSELAELWIGLNHIMDVSKEVNSKVLEIFREGISVTSSVQVKDSLLFWAKQVLGLNMDEPYRNTTILCSAPSDVDRNCCMSILTRGEEANRVQMLHWKGAPDFVLSLCSHYYDVDGTMQVLDEEKRPLFSRLIEDHMGSNSLQCFAFAYKQVMSKDSKSQKFNELPEDNVHDDDEETFDVNMYHGFALVGLVRLRTPYAPEVKEAVAACRDLGINVKLVVDDDINAARIMALSCGILGPGEDDEASIIEASHFRNSTVEARTNMARNIQVMANASPTDKLLLVQCLGKKAEVVAITSSCIRDSPSLVEADVGMFMDNPEAEVAKEDADIIIGENIGTIASILRSGRYVCKKIENFLQLHLILNLSAFAINFILGVLGNEVQLTSFHLLWTNLIVESALANLVDPGMSTSTLPKIYPKGPVINKVMWRNIAIQSLFQVTILLVLAMKGKDILHVSETVLSTMIFNCYVMCQVFGLIGTLERTNSFRRQAVHENYLFFMTVVVILALQVSLLEIMRFVSHWKKLDLKMWFICIGISGVSIPVGYAAEWVSVIMRVI